MRRYNTFSRRPCEHNPGFKALTGARALPIRIRDVLRQLAEAGRALRSRVIHFEDGVGKACKCWTLTNMVAHGLIARSGIPGHYLYTVTEAGRGLLDRLEGMRHA